MWDLWPPDTVMEAGVGDFSVRRVFVPSEGL